MRGLGNSEVFHPEKVDQQQIMLCYIYYSQRMCDWVIPFIVWNVCTIRLQCFPQVTTFDLCLLIHSEQITLGHG